MSSLTDKLIEEIRKEAQALKISNVLIALSGGPDSVLLAFLLREAGLKVMAMHCNFHLRGDESDRDMSFVENFCHKLDIPLKIKHFEVDNYLKNNKGISTEMACRDLRYDWFEEVLKEKDFDRLATGHNADDNIETFFLNLLRGAGSKGLKGMVVDNGRIWRPLLKTHKKTILELLKENYLDYIIDSSNLKSEFRRNFLRNKIFPLIKEQWPGFETSLDKTLENLRTENEIIESSLKTSLPSSGKPLSVSEIIKFPAPLLLIKRYIEKAGPYNTTPVEILDAIKANKPHIPKWKLRFATVYLKKGLLFIEMIHGESSS